jgi:hypothetical protein
MPHDHVFSAGSLAKSYLEVAEWYGKHTDDIGARYLCQPFMGFGRMASAMLRDDVTIDSDDFQHLSWAIAEGVFNAKVPVTNVDKPHYRKGRAYNGKLVQGIDERSAGFIDWIKDEGTPLDIACTGMAVPGQTMRGWMSRWTGSFDKFYAKFEQIREQCAEFIPMPGTFNFREEDFFRNTRQYFNVHYDALILDPPRLQTTADAYSRGAWVKLNACLGGTVAIKPWTDRNYFYLLSRIAEIKSNYLLMTWAVGYPDLKDIKGFVSGLGEVEEEIVWEAHQKTIYGWRVNRQNKGDK